MTVPVTVAEILALPILAEARVVAGRQGLGNNVRWVHVADVRDIARLLQGGELLLTTGLPLADSPGDGAAFIHELRAVGAAGLILELIRQFRAVPPEMAAAADAAGLPVITLSREVPFVQVTEAAHTLIVNRQYAQIREAEAVATTLNGIALRQEGVTAILRALARELENPVLFLPADPGQPALMHPPQLVSQRQLEALRSRLCAGWVEAEWSPGGRSVRTLVAPVRVGPEAAGHLLVPEFQRRLNDLDTLVVDRAATTVAFELLRQRSMRQQWQMSTGELLEDILAGSFRDPRELEFRARELGVELAERKFLVVTFHAPDQGARNQLEQRLRTLTAHLGVPCLQAARGDRVRVLVVFRDAQALPEQLRTLLAAIDRPAGVGRPFQDLTAARQALEQAECTLTLRLRHPGAGFGPFFDSTGIYRLLLAGVRSDEMARFVADELGPLLPPVRSEDAELLPTLRLLLDGGLNMAQAARELHLTRPAVYYRKQRIEALLGCRLEDPEKRISLGLALRALELLPSSGALPGGLALQQPFTGPGAQAPG